VARKNGNAHPPLQAGGWALGGPLMVRGEASKRLWEDSQRGGGEVCQGSRRQRRNIGVRALEPHVGRSLGAVQDAARDTMKRRSFETYLDIARLHLLSALRDTKLNDLTREQVQRMYARKRDEGLRSQGYAVYTACSPSPSTTRCVGGFSNTTCARRSAGSSFWRRLVSGCEVRAGKPPSST
jgi:hypothetical protein